MLSEEISAQLPDGLRVEREDGLLILTFDMAFEGSAIRAGRSVRKHSHEIVGRDISHSHSSDRRLSWKSTEGRV